MPFCGQSSSWSKFAFVLLLIAIAIHCTGLGTPNWIKSSKTGNSVNITIGLWKMVNCSGSLVAPCIGSSIPDSYETTEMTITRGIECTALLWMVMATVLSFFYVTSPAAQTQRVAAWVMLFSFFAMGLTILGIVIWTINLPADHYIYWSAGLTVIAGSLCMLVGILMIQDIRVFDYQGIRTKQEEKRARRKAKRKKKEAN